MLKSLFRALQEVTPALIAAMASIITVVYIQYRSKKIAFFQTFFARKLGSYSEFWASVGYYERDSTTANYARLQAALHTLCLFAPLAIYKRAMETASEVGNTGCLSGKTIQELMDMMRIDLDQCRRLKFSEIKPSDPEINIRDPANRK